MRYTQCTGIMGFYLYWSAKSSRMPTKACLWLALSFFVNYDPLWSFCICNFIFISLTVTLPAISLKVQLTADWPSANPDDVHSDSNDDDDNGIVHKVCCCCFCMGIVDCDHFQPWHLPCITPAWWNAMHMVTNIIFPYSMTKLPSPSYNKCAPTFPRPFCSSFDFLFIHNSIFCPYASHSSERIVLLVF